MSLASLKSEFSSYAATLSTDLNKNGSIQGDRTNAKALSTLDSLLALLLTDGYFSNSLKVGTVFDSEQGAQSTKFLSDFGPTIRIGASNGANTNAITSENGILDFGDNGAYDLLMQIHNTDGDPMLIGHVYGIAGMEQHIQFSTTRDGNGIYWNNGFSTSDVRIVQSGFGLAFHSDGANCEFHAGGGQMDFSDCDIAIMTSLGSGDYSAYLTFGSGTLDLNAATISLGVVSGQVLDIIAGSGASAPSTTSAGTVTNRYGGATNFLGNPTGWIDVKIANTPRKIPYY